MKNIIDFGKKWNEKNGVTKEIEDQAIELNINAFYDLVSEYQLSEHDSIKATPHAWIKFAKKWFKESENYGKYPEACIQELAINSVKLMAQFVPSAILIEQHYPFDYSANIISVD